MIYGETRICNLMHQGITMEVVRCPQTLWCGSLGYAVNGEDEPDIGALLEKYQRFCGIPKQKAPLPDWSCCISIDYWREGAAPRGILFAQQVLSREQSAEHDVYAMPESLFIRLSATSEVAQAAFGRDRCEPFELFGVIKDALPALGYAFNENGPQEIELYNHSAGLAYAYVPVVKTR